MQPVSELDHFHMGGPWKANMVANTPTPQFIPFSNYFRRVSINIHYHLFKMSLKNVLAAAVVSWFSIHSHVWAF